MRHRKQWRAVVGSLRDDDEVDAAGSRNDDVVTRYGTVAVVIGSTSFTDVIDVDDDEPNERDVIVDSGDAHCDECYKDAVCRSMTRRTRPPSKFRQRRRHEVGGPTTTTTTSGGSHHGSPADRKCHPTTHLLGWHSANDDDDDDDKNRMLRQQTALMTSSYRRAAAARSAGHAGEPSSSSSSAAAGCQFCEMAAVAGRPASSCDLAEEIVIVDGRRRGPDALVAAAASTRTCPDVLLPGLNAAATVQASPPVCRLSTSASNGDRCAGGSYAGGQWTPSTADHRGKCNAN